VRLTGDVRVASPERVLTTPCSVERISR
jgi:hypothetical protein